MASMSHPSNFHQTRRKASDQVWVCDFHGTQTKGPCQRLVYGNGQELKGKTLYPTEDQCMEFSPCSFRSKAGVVDMDIDIADEFDGFDSKKAIFELENDLEFKYLGNSQAVVNATLDKVFSNPLEGGLWNRRFSLGSFIQNPRVRKWVFGDIDEENIKWFKRLDEHSPQFSTSPRMNAFKYIWRYGAESENFPQVAELARQILRESPLDGSRWKLAFSDPSHPAVLPLLNANLDMFHIAMMELSKFPDLDNSRAMIFLLMKADDETVMSAFRRFDYETAWDTALRNFQLPIAPQYPMTPAEMDQWRIMTETMQNAAAVNWINDFQQSVRDERY